MACPLLSANVYGPLLSDLALHLPPHNMCCCFPATCVKRCATRHTPLSPGYCVPKVIPIQSASYVSRYSPLSLSRATPLIVLPEASTRDRMSSRRFHTKTPPPLYVRMCHLQAGMSTIRDRPHDLPVTTRNSRGEESSMPGVSDKVRSWWLLYSNA